MPYFLAYDSHCGPCKRFRDAVHFLDAGRKMRYISLERADQMGKLSSVPATLRFASFHLIGPNGTVWSGSSAIPKLVSLLPGGGLPAEVIRANPVVSRSAKRVYSVLSRVHGSGTCAAKKGDQTHAPRVDDGSKDSRGRYQHRLSMHARP